MKLNQETKIFFVTKGNYKNIVADPSVQPQSVQQPAGTETSPMPAQADPGPGNEWPPKVAEPGDPPVQNVVPQPATATPGGAVPYVSPGPPKKGPWRGSAAAKPRDFETSAERKVKNEQIRRMNAVTSAITILKTPTHAPEVMDVLSLAEILVHYIETGEFEEEAGDGE